MSICTFLATDYPLYEEPPMPGRWICLDLPRDFPCDTEGEEGVWLMAFPDVACYTDLRCGAVLDQMDSDAMVKRYIRCIRELLRHTDRVEIWSVWLMGDYYEADERPVVRRCRMEIDDVTSDLLRELSDAKIWYNPDKWRPSFYCLEVTR